MVEVRNKIDSTQNIADKAAGTAVLASASSNEFTIKANQLQDLVKQFLDDSFPGSRPSPESKSAVSGASAPAPDSSNDVELL